MLKVFQAIDAHETIQRVYLDSRTDWIEKTASMSLPGTTKDSINEHIREFPNWLSKFLQLSRDMIVSEHEWITEHLVELKPSVSTLHALKKIAHKLDVWLALYSKTQTDNALVGIVEAYEHCLDLLQHVHHDHHHQIEKHMEPKTKIDDQEGHPQPSDETSSSSFIKVLIRPFVLYHRRYAELEKRTLWNAFDKCVLRNPDSGVDSALNSIEECLQIADSVTDSALNRCSRFGYGTAAQGLSIAVDAFYTEFIQRLFAFLRQVRSLTGFDNTSVGNETGMEGS